MAATHRKQINVEITPRLMLIAQQLALIAEESVPQLLRPVIEEYLEEQFAQNSHLQAAVAHIEEGRSQTAKKASVTSLPNKTAGRTSKD